MLFRVGYYQLTEGIHIAEQRDAANGAQENNMGITMNRRYDISRFCGNRYPGFRVWGMGHPVPPPNQPSPAARLLRLPLKGGVTVSGLTALNLTS